VAETRWALHDREWRDPAQVVSGMQEAGVAPELLRMRVRGDWWELLDRLDVTLLVSREYEHLLVAFAVVAGRPHVSSQPLPHPSGIAFDGRRVVVASTRSPNQVFEFSATDGGPLLPRASRYYPGSLYLHDLAFVGGRLHGNAVGQNAVVRLGEEAERVWWPSSIGDEDFERNYLQLNSIAAGRTLRESFFSASAEQPGPRRPGQRSFPVDGRGVIFSGRTREPLVRGLTRPHSARLHEGRVWVDNSGYGELCMVERGRLEPVAVLPGWTRGLGFAGDVAFVGTSRVIPRFHRYAPGLDVERSTCGVQAVDVATGAVLASVTWPSGNQVFAVECVPREITSGWPFTARRQSRRVRELFYTFTP
jgi:uncharacterized protein (TIGR03032 family)